MIDFSKELKDLELKSLNELGEIENKFGKKYKDKKIKEIYELNKNYFKWVKNLTIEQENYIGNFYYFEWEYSRRAIILYDELMEFYNNQGK